MNNSLVTTQIQHVADALGLGGVDPLELKNTLVQTAFRTDTPVSDEQMAALLIVAAQYKLNPWTKEIYAFPDKNKGIIPVVGVDGWSRIVNSSPNLDGIQFRYSDVMLKMEGAKVEAPAWIECIITRKDREQPIVVREYLDETYRAPFKNKNGYLIEGPWQSHPKRFLRHKAFIQAVRIAFGFVGIYDQDEAERIAESSAQQPVRTVTEDLPEGYADYEAEQLQLMREQAMLGTDALSNAFKKLEAGALKNTFWKRHSASLKQAAQQADQSAKGETYEHSPA